ncbi:MAG: HD-GYP domain-containing protein [Leptospiraceae bacterium]|nr:HD-GYP domain-containing protein [Leptospiraceae bacterium]
MKTLQAVIDGLVAHVALLDETGVIQLVNRAWCRFADDNGSRLSDYGVGSNYLHLLSGAAQNALAASKADPDAGFAIAARDGIYAVIQQDTERFQLTYPCHAPHEQRWFLLTVSRFDLHEHSYIMVTHENVTTLKQSEQVIREALVGTVSALSDMSEIRDPYTAGHQQNVAALAREIGHSMGLDHNELEGLVLAASIHDIGKIAVPAEILTRPGRLGELELRMIQRHSQLGFDIIASIPFPWPLAEIIQQHHERLDGSGYPRGLSGDQIRIEAQIIAVADVLDAMISHRPYRPGLGAGAAFAELQAGRGRSYNTAIVDICSTDTFQAHLTTIYPRLFSAG